MHALFKLHMPCTLRCYLRHTQISPSHHMSSRDQREVTSNGLRWKYHSGRKIPDWAFRNSGVFNILSEDFLPLSMTFFLWVRKRRTSLVNIPRRGINTEESVSESVICGYMQVVLQYWVQLRSRSVCCKVFSVTGRDNLECEIDWNTFASAINIRNSIM